MEHWETDCETSEEFTENLKDTEVPAPAHISHDSDSQRPKKWHPGSAVFLLTSRKIEIAKYACEPRWQGLLAEDALAKQYTEQKNWWLDNSRSQSPQRGRCISKQLPIRSRGTKILPLSGYNLIRVKWKLHRRRKGVYESFSSRRKSRKSFTLTSLWNHRTSTPHRSETNGIAERVVRRIKEGTSAVLLQSGLVGGFHRILLLSAKHARSLLDSVKDDSGAYVVFTEQGSSASQITAAKVMDAIARLPGCAGQADHKVLSEGCESRNNHRCAVLVQDLAPQWIQSYPCKTKTSQETQKSLMKFLEPTRKPKVIHTDNSLTFGKSCEEMSWNHCTSTPHRSETDGITERAVRRVKEGTSSVLLQSGSGWKMVGGFHGVLLLSAKHSRSLVWWEDSIWKAFRNALWRTSNTVWSNGRNITLSLRKTSQGSSNLVRKFYLVYFSDMHWSRCEFWKGDFMVADIEELEIFQRLNAKEVLTPPRGEKI